MFEKSTGNERSCIWLVTIVNNISYVRTAIEITVNLNYCDSRITVISILYPVPLRLAQDFLVQITHVNVVASQRFDLKL